MAKKIIIIGAGAAGITAASSARDSDSEADIKVFTKDENVAYSPCMIPWILEGKANWESIIMRTPEYYSKEKNISIFMNTNVDSVNGDSKTVSANGKTYEYDSLVIATGGKVFMPPISGIDLEGVFVVRTIRDGKNIETALKNAKDIVIGGAGVIGLEVAFALANIGKNVTIIEMMDQVIPRIADKDMANEIQKHLEDKGIKFVMNAPIKSVNGTDKVESITAGEKEYPCDMIIFATGVRANIDIPLEMGFDIGQFGAVIVSPTLQPYKKGRLVPNVYVAGDLIQCESSILPGPTMSQLGSSAVRQGEIAGKNVAGNNILIEGVASPWVSVIGDLEIAGTGMSTSLSSWYGLDEKLNIVTGKATGFTRARYYPGKKELTVKIIADKNTHKMIGAQIVSGEGATGRINWLTSAIINNMTAESFLSCAENAYCPPTSMVKDVVISAVEDLCKKLKSE